jgi:hypothetical protein
MTTLRKARIFGSRLYVLHGSYWKKSEAQEIAKKLRAKGVLARVTPQSIEAGKHYYQVWQSA